MVDLRLQIPSSFYEEEVRTGFPVTRQRKEVWAVELDLLARFDEVCRKYDLHYCMAAGSLLGAVRHKGFIPWDDDIDVYMLRGDYEKLMAVGYEFKEPYFLQTTYTEKYVVRRHAQLRNSDTTGFILTDRYYYNINKGLFIDIFPLDGVPDDTSLYAEQKKKDQRLRREIKLFNYVYGHAPDKHLSKRISLAIKSIYAAIRGKNRMFREFEDNLQKYSVDGTRLWGNRTLVFDCPKSRRPIEDWKNLTVVPFEFLEVPVPANYDEVLRQQYGNYMKIPEDKGGTVHGSLTISTEHSYKEMNV